ncbi:DEAD/DEAH box helicase family protein [Terrabacter terrigena]|uniref:DEAD/DEAH box helicase family protein n=1 Tax=Terrabacter terrigena TaxID=574718 RepID=A0ABW3MXL2_9MICO
MGRLILAKRADGKYASTIGGTGLSIPRQVGKTFLVGAIVFALCLVCPNLTVIWTAHRMRTAEETFGKMQKFARRRRIKPHVKRVVLGSGEEAIEFRNGSRILFGARESGFGLGFDEVDVLIFDEAQRLKESTLEDMIPATNQSRQPTSALLLFMGTPPRPTDAGEVFKRMRTEALSGEDDDTGWVELGADDDYVPTPLPAPMTEKDWAQIAKANPSFPEDTPHEAILRMRKKLGSDAFLREGAGVWDADQAGGDGLSYAAWRDLADPDAPLRRDLVLGVDVAEDRSAWIGAAWRRDDGSSQVMLHVTDEFPDGRFPAYRVADEVARLTEKYRTTAISAKSMEADLVRAGAKVSAVTATEFAAACGALADAVTEGQIHHGNQTALNTAVKAARWRSAGVSGERAWKLKDCPEIGPLAATTRALHGLSNRPAYDLLQSVW